MRAFLFLCCLALLSVPVLSQPTQAERDVIAQLTQQDFQAMLAQLGIPASALRPGPSGNPEAPDAANTDEAEVSPYHLPDPLRLADGRPVLTARTWAESRRPQLVEAFEQEMYGHLPDGIPGVSWQVVRERDTLVGRFPIREKRLKGIVDNAAYPAISVEIDLLLAVPQEASGPVPVVLEFGFIDNPFRRGPVQPIGLGSPHEPTWKEQLIAQGWGYAIVVPSSIQADNGAGLRAGIIGLVNKEAARNPEDWGTLRAWAWGASRALDYFEADPLVDEGRVAIEGLSRYGKAALVAMAFEPRFSLGFIGSSGAGGAKILRRNFGEQVENLASSYEYHWFCGNFIKYASILHPADLPVDAHELVALCAPRPVFISVGSPFVEGNWVDAKGMFVAGREASPVYELLGQRGLGVQTFPPLGTPLVAGELAFRQHAGGHSTGPNWSTWIAWANRYWGG